MITWGGESGATAVESFLKEAGFTVSERCCARPSCFDFVARKNGRVLFIKILPDIGNLSLKDSRELKGISEFFSAAPILVGEETRENPLEDDTVYSRYDISAFTLKTFANMVVHKAYPLIQASPGGYYVEIDGETIRKRRQELGLSIGDTAKLIGISRRTVYGYERGMAKASVTAAYNIISKLGVPVARPLNIFENAKQQRKCCLLTSARRMMSKKAILQRIFNKFARYRITTVKKAPFDFVFNVPDDKARIMGGVANENEPQLKRRVDEILSVSKIVQAHPVLITEGQEPPNTDITCIDSGDFLRTRNPENLIAKA